MTTQDMTDKIIKLRVSLFIMAWLRDRNGQFDEERFNNKAAELINLQNTSGIEIPRKCEWDTDWDTWDGNVDSIVLHSDGYTQWLIDNAKVQTKRVEPKKAEKRTRTTQKPKQEKPVEKKRTGRLF